MSGIAGIVYPDVFQMNQLILPMLETLKSRSPQDQSQKIYTHQNIQIGTTGGRFASNEKETIHIGIDGNIYNSEELRKELIKKGYDRVREKSRDEVLIHAYELWGSSCFERLAGDFALMILDQNKNQILLCRDRIGKKPLYWFQDQHHFIFASELKAILATGVVPQTPAMDGLSSYLFFGYIPQDMSPIEGISKLLPAHYLCFNSDRSKSIASFWSYSSYFEKTNENSMTTIIKDLDLLLRESVKVRIPKKRPLNEEPLGCFVLGGIGSAGIAYYLANLLSAENLRSFAVGFEGENDEDMKTAANASGLLGISNESFLITSKTFLDDLVKIAWHLDEPIADPNIISTWKLAEIAAKTTSTVFSGMGSDELFAGHSRYSIAEQGSKALRRIVQTPMAWISRVLIPFFNLFYKPFAYELLKQSRTNPWQFHYLKQNALFDQQELKKASPKLGGIFDPEVFLHKFHHLPRVQSTVASFLYFDIKTRLADCFLLQYDRLTAAHGLDWKAPFLDRRIVEYLAGLPEPEILQETETASYLKKILKDVFPRSIVSRPKKTRKYFLKTWIETETYHHIFKTLLNGNLVETGLISKGWLIQQLDSLGHRPHAFRYLWSILLLEIWFHLYIDSPIRPTPPKLTVEELLKELM
ncbi:MAG: asparagine synthase (glutamine-hydrolyzing) [Waddliaceae bacterium]